MSRTRTTGEADEGRRIPWQIGGTPMVSLGRSLGRRGSVKAASGEGCWKGGELTFGEECWVVMGLISSSTRLQTLEFTTPGWARRISRAEREATSQGADEVIVGGRVTKTA